MIYDVTSRSTITSHLIKTAATKKQILVTQIIKKDEREQKPNKPNAMSPYSN